MSIKTLGKSKLIGLCLIVGIAMLMIAIMLSMNTANVAFAASGGESPLT